MHCIAVLTDAYTGGVGSKTPQTKQRAHWRAGWITRGLNESRGLSDELLLGDALVGADYIVCAEGVAGTG